MPKHDPENLRLKEMLIRTLARRSHMLTAGDQRGALRTSHFQTTLQARLNAMAAAATSAYRDLG